MLLMMKTVHEKLLSGKLFFLTNWTEYDPKNCLIQPKDVLKLDNSLKHADKFSPQCIIIVLSNTWPQAACGQRAGIWWHTLVLQNRMSWVSVDTTRSL